MLLRNKLLKALWPLGFFLLAPLRSLVSFSPAPTWYDQSTFYFSIFTILVISTTAFTTSKQFDHSEKNIFDIRKTTIYLGIVFVCFFIFFSYFSVIRLFDLTLEKPDIHAFITVLWNIAHGNGFLSSYLDAPRSWLSVHFEPLLAILSPLTMLPYSTLTTPIALLLLQVLVGVSGIIPVYLIAKKKLESNVHGLVCGLIYLLLPALQFQLLYDFHPEIFSLILSLWAIFFLTEKRYKPFLMLLALIILSREEFALYASIFGVFMIFSKGYPKKLASFLVLFGVGYLILVKMFLLPFFGAGVVTQAQLSMMPNIPANSLQLIHNPLDMVRYYLQYIFSPRKIQYLVLMLAHTGFIALLSPIVLLSLPFFLINLFLNFDLPSSIFWHYQAWLLPILLWATIDTLSRFPNKSRKHYTAFLFSSALLTSLLFGPINILGLDFGNTQKGVAHLYKNTSVMNIYRTVAIIPQEATVASDTSLSPFFSARKYYYLYPDRQDTQYIVLSSYLTLTRNPEVHTRLTKEGYCLKVHNDILLYKKTKKCNRGWNDTVVEVSQDITPPSFPLYSKKINGVTSFTFKVTLDKKILNKSFLTLLHYQMLSYYPNLIEIQISRDGKKFMTIAKCSAITDSFCESRYEISQFVSKINTIFVKINMSTNVKSEKKLQNVHADKLIIRALKINRVN